MAQDDLKPLDEIFTADPVHSLFVMLDKKTGSLRPVVIDDHYSFISDINLTASAPKDIRSQFETSRNLLLYAWFVLRFIPVAELQAYASLELALKTRISQVNEGILKKHSGLKRMLVFAIQQNWICDTGIRQYQRIEEKRNESLASMKRILGDEYASYGPIGAKSYVSILEETIPDSRNEYAHGSSTLPLMNSAYLTLEICCDIINQLFPAKQ